MTSVLDEDILYLVIALWKLEKPIVRKAPSGAFFLFGVEFERWAELLRRKVLLIVGWREPAV